MQVDTVWACVDLRSRTVATLPLFVYDRDSGGQKQLARKSTLYALLHDSPNARMTPADFWRCLIMWLDLRGNAYARLTRNGAGEVIAMWPMPADQVRVEVQTDGSVIYLYALDGNVAVLAAESVLHIRGIGNGTVGLDKMAFASAGINESAQQTRSASTIWGSSGKPTGALMIDKVLRPDQRAALLTRFAGMAQGNESRLYLLEADMKYQQLSITPEQQQLLESRRFSVEQLCRWYDTPPVLVGHANVTTWGSGIEQIVDGWYKLSLRPLLVTIEQAITKMVMTPRQRATMSVEFSLDALLRGSLKDRMGVYSTGVQNGIMSRNDCRQLENLPPDPSPIANMLTVQTNLIQIDKLGQMPANQGAANAAAQTPVAQ
jgi:HK97 family phage portal protein